MYPALAITDFGLGLEDRAPDYLVKGSRVQVWISLTHLPWWSGFGLGIGVVGILTEAALINYRRTEAQKWMNQAKQILSNDSAFTNVAATYSEAGGAISITATTTVDFAREYHAPGRIIDLLKQAGLNPVEEKWKILQRGPTGKKEAPLFNAPNPDNPSGKQREAPSGEGLLDKLSLTLGISTGVLLAGGALAAVLILRNR